VPTYEYRCDKCGKTFEVFQKITDDPVKKCQDCGGEVRRLVNATNFILKGNGWYKTDYAKKEVPSKEVSSCDAGGSKPACQSCPAGPKS
jgi:putative FmdB family regulatory protein